MGQCLGRPNASDAAAQQAFSSDVRSGATTSNTAGTSGAPSMATAGTAYATPNSRTTGIRASGAAEQLPSPAAAATSSRSTPAAATPSMSAMSALDSSVAASTGYTGQRHPAAAASDARGYRGASQSHTHERHGTNLQPRFDAIAPSAPTAAAPTAPPAELLAEKLTAAERRCDEMQEQLEQVTQHAAQAARERREALAQAQQARAAEEQAGAARDNAVREVNDLLNLGVIDQPNPELFRGPVRFGAAAHARLLTMVLARGGTGQRLGPGWAFKTDTGAKLHKAKCGNQESFHWYHYSTLTGRNNTGLVLCDKRHCQWAFEHEEAYLVN